MRGLAIDVTTRSLPAVAAAFVTSVLLASAQDGSWSGLYEIVSGTYTECCGIAGGTRSPLPSPAQSFVQLTVDPQTALATMTFLGRDLQTVFSIVPCPIGNPIQFRFDFGFASSNSILFHIDPGPPPYGIYWGYAVNYSTNSLLINGMLGMADQECADAFTQFGHSNVVAQLVTGPSLSVAESSNEGALLQVQGHAGWTNVIEASTNLVSWTPISTNVMPATICPDCPYIQFRDAASTNLVKRYYRSFEIP